MLEKLLPLLAAVGPFLLRSVEKWVNRPPRVAGARIPWSLTVVVMDGTAMRSDAEIPVREAVKFIEERTRFDFDVRYVETSIEHTYASFPVEDGMRYVMLRDDMPATFFESLPVGTSYLFLYKMNGKEPLQAGSSMALEHGLNIQGKLRPYATVPTDPWWYNSDPAGGFNTWSASIVTHEIINTIQAKVEAPPYNCGQLVGEDHPTPYLYEGRRLEKLTERCYELLGDEAG